MKLLSLRNERAYSQVCVTQQKGIAMKIIYKFRGTHQDASYFCQRTFTHLGLTT